MFRVFFAIVTVHFVEKTNTKIRNIRIRERQLKLFKVTLLPDFIKYLLFTTFPYNIVTIRLCLKHLGNNKTLHNNYIHYEIQYFLFFIFKTNIEVIQDYSVVRLYQMFYSTHFLQLTSFLNNILK